MIYRFTVPGHPISKSNFRPRGGGHSPQSLVRERQLFEYEDIIRSHVGEQMRKNGWTILEGPVQMLIVVFQKADKMDTANASKSDCDALQGVLYENDKQVRLISTFDGGVDKDNPRIEILAAPLGKIEYLQVGDLAYAVPKSVDGLLKEKKMKKSFTPDLCPKCGLSQERRSVVLAGTRRTLKVCKNDHGFLVY